MRLESSIEYLQDFVYRFFDHIDADSRPVKGTANANTCLTMKVAIAAIAFNPLFWNFAARTGIPSKAVRSNVENGISGR